MEIEEIIKALKDFYEREGRRSTKPQYINSFIRISINRRYVGIYRVKI